MTKPHEEKWKKHPAGSLVASHNGDGPIIALVYGKSGEEVESRVELIAAAPATARALLRLYRAFPEAHATEEEADACKEARDLLRELGMLP